MAIPTQVNERWSLYFVHDQLADGRRIRVLNIVDDFSRKFVGQLVDTSISVIRLVRYLDGLALTRSLPTSIVLDNSPELTSKAKFFWAQKTSVKLCFIQPGKPTQNAFIERIKGLSRDGCLNQHWFRSLENARRIIGDWKKHYNNVRLRSSLGYQAPAVFEAQAA